MAAELPPLVDIGLNLTHDSFQSDLPEVVAEAVDAGVAQMVITGATVSGSEAAIELSRKYPGMMYATAGIHPHHANDCNAETESTLRDLAQSPEVVAVGECGLDFFRNFSPHEDQETCFRLQLKLACELGMPVFLHERDSHETFAKILRDYIEDLPAAVVHCFTGSAAALEDYLGMGCSIGVTGWVCDERRGQGLRELVPTIPEERLMIETDAPYLLPRDLRPKPKTNRNEPKHLRHVGQVVAELRGVPFEVLANATTTNARRFFGLKEAVEVKE